MTTSMTDPMQVFETGLLARFETIHAATKSGDSEIQKFYDGCTVFVTGGSGFLGKQLIEKLFRATNVLQIFMLMRPKKGKSIKERVNEMLKDPVYDLLRKQKPNFGNKLVPIAGDIAELRLGMCEEDWNIVTKETEIIFHGAATTRFDVSLRLATLINARGTKEMITLGTMCRKLKAFVYVSTAFSHAKPELINKQVFEDFYKSPIDPETLINLVDTVEDSRLRDITPRLIKGWPNTYVFTKAVAEELIRMNGKFLPFCIVRPAVVTCSHREPSPGWLDISTVYGANGLLAGCSLGAIHTVRMKGECNANLTPVDYVNNAVIAAAWITSKRKDEHTKIYTIGSSRNEMIWKRLHNIFNSNPLIYSIPSSIGYTFVMPAENPVLFFIYSSFFHIIPSYFVDAVLLLLGKKRMAVKLSKKIYKMSNILSYFTINQWYFDDKNLSELYKELSPVDQEIFDFDVAKIDWDEFMLIWTLGLRKYLIKDGITGTNYGRKKQTVFSILMLFIMPLYFYMLYKIVYFGLLSIILFFHIFNEEQK